VPPGSWAATAGHRGRDAGGGGSERVARLRCYPPAGLPNTVIFIASQAAAAAVVCARVSGVTWQPELDELGRRQELAERMGGPDKIARQHQAGRMTVRERLTALLDEGSFQEIGALAGTAAYGQGGELTDFTPANFVTGTGRLAGRKVVLGADDFTIRGGAADAAIMGKQIYAEQLANQMRLPIVRLVEGTGGGGSVKMLEQMGNTYVPVNPGWDYVVDNMSTVPVVAAGLGPVAGLGAARLCAAHLSVLVEGTAQLFVAGPPVVKSGAGEDVSKEQLGGSAVHARNAAVDLVAASEPDAFVLLKRFLSYLPPSAYQLPQPASCQDPAGRREEALLSAIPRDRRQPYRIRAILQAVFDVGSVLEVQGYGGSVVTALARLDGHPVGVVAGDPYVAGGCLTVEGTEALTGIRARLDAVRNPLRTAERFGIEEIIDPRETRPLLCDWVKDAYAVLPACPGRPSFGTRP